MKKPMQDFPDGPMIKNLPANARGTGLVTGQGRFHMQQASYTHVPQLLIPTCLIITSVSVLP